MTRVSDCSDLDEDTELVDDAMHRLDEVNSRVLYPRLYKTGGSRVTCRDARNIGNGKSQQ